MLERDVEVTNLLEYQFTPEGLPFILFTKDQNKDPEHLRSLDWIIVGCGIHGDEWSVIPLLETILLEKSGDLPNIIFLPQISPSAVTRGTRVNAEVIDGKNVNLNRVFEDKQQQSKEALAIMNFLRQFWIKATYIFHEDYDFKDPNDAYLYVMYHTMHQEREHFFGFITQLLKKARKVGLHFRTKLDDPTDPNLNFLAIDGVILNQIQFEDSGSLCGFTLRKLFAKIGYEFEIPMKASKIQKLELIRFFFEEIILHEHQGDPTLLNGNRYRN